MREEDAKRTIHIGNIELYKDALVQFKDKVKDLYNEGVISKGTAKKIIKDAEYKFFNLIVNIEYK